MQVAEDGHGRWVIVKPEVEREPELVLRWCPEQGWLPLWPRQALTMTAYNEALSLALLLDVIAPLGPLE